MELEHYITTYNGTHMSTTVSCYVLCIKESSYSMANSTKEDVLHGMTESPDHVSALPGMRRVRGWEVCGHDLIAISTHLHAAT